MSIVRSYFRVLWRILRAPRSYFESWSTQGSPDVPSALSFALVTHWLGAGLAYLWQILFGTVWGDTLSQLLDIAGDVAEIDHPGRGSELVAMRDRVLSWFWSAGPVIVDPFLTAIQLCVTALFVYMGARLLVSPGKRGAPKEINYATALKVVCFGSAPAVLAVIPFAGPALAFIGVTWVTIIGARSIYHVSTARGTVIALFPKLLVLGFILTMIAFVLLIVLRAVTSLI